MGRTVKITYAGAGLAVAVVYTVSIAILCVQAEEFIRTIEGCPVPCAADVPLSVELEERYSMSLNGRLSEQLFARRQDHISWLYMPLLIIGNLILVPLGAVCTAALLRTTTSRRLRLAILGLAIAGAVALAFQVVFYDTIIEISDAVE